VVHPSLDAWAARPWTEAPLVALDLEGTGSQDGADEAILEIAAIRLVDGRPDVDNAYTTLLNPRRPVPTRPWISPGLTTATVAAAPILADVEPHLSIRLNGRLLVGHNVGVDWRLLHRHCPSITPVGLLDTYKLARQVTTSGSRALANLLDAFDLTERVHAAAPGGRPHRALWDTAGAALLLAALVERHWSSPPTLTALIAICGQPLEPGPAESAGKPSEPTLF
jgi:DNA polymerase III epsilon subunit-like protein